ncbi:MAG: SiaC family regulatory phosphoprotein [Candidatus Aminicenantes bacterium]|nr:SiaC family regulatory phosphoprotein [Candidatus Aminicenantes bacterium]
MEDLIIKPTDKSLAIDISYGIMNFSGRSILTDPKIFFEPINTWVNKYLKNPAEETVINIKLEYIDTASTQSLYYILRQINSVRKKELVLMVNWYIEDEDPEMKELGEMIEQRLGIEFQYIPF